MLIKAFNLNVAQLIIFHIKVTNYLKIKVLLILRVRIKKTNCHYQLANSLAS